VPPEGSSGAIEFLDPRVNANAFTIEGAACFNRKFIINPAPGNLLMFPSYLTHWVQPNGDSKADARVRAHDMPPKTVFLCGAALAERPVRGEIELGRKQPGGLLHRVQDVRA